VTIVNRIRFTPEILCITVICLACLLGGCRRRGGPNDPDIMGTKGDGNGIAARSYSTSFSGIENPIRENGNWVGGSDAGASIFAGGSLWTGGRLWGNVQTTAGIAFGVDEPTTFGDPTAILKGAWGPEQVVSATVEVSKVPTGRCCHEVELRLRTTISSDRITGYEAYCSVMPDKPYCHIARWNGPNGSYWNFETGSSESYLANGDVMQATATGANPTIITLYKNGVQILQATDTGAAGGGFRAYGPWTSGNPGIGFYDQPDIRWADFGFTSFTATAAAHK
jgi:hypothetical protein